MKKTSTGTLSGARIAGSRPDGEGGVLRLEQGAGHHGRHADQCGGVGVSTLIYINRASCNAC
ncbi:hypothetical protein [Cupriavidus alkaliphilus]|uniref:hypothetical protein n=1 Tax=Cupriavidus alkaliphilus TaxID=942866 RepID=UPI00160A5DB2|nr:hypothetical protein [Cupriavidus alkaliphilus]MBB2920946.1 hypothetical protein [Cupriavidus alkaliphilus]